MFKATTAIPGDYEQEQFAEVRLWQEVILSTVQEWLLGALRCHREAGQYLLNDHTDLHTVCQSAGMDGGRLCTRLLKFRDQAATSARARTQQK